MLLALLLLGAFLVTTARKAQAYIGGKVADVELRAIGGGHYLRADAAGSFLAMRAAAENMGITLKVNSSFRTFAEQAELYAKYLAGTGALAAKPGYSNHQGGTAVDIETGGTGTPVYAWLAKYADTYGFRRTVASEPWHWEYLA